MENLNFEKGDLLQLSSESAGLLWNEKFKDATVLRDKKIQSIMFTGAWSKQKEYVLCLVVLEDDAIVGGYLGPEDLSKLE